MGASRTARPATAGAVGPNYDARKDELYAQREAVREAAWQAELGALAEGHRERIAAMKRLHAAQSRRQKEFLRSIGVPDLSPEEITERARRRTVLDLPPAKVLATTSDVSANPSARRA